jgi:hypothetical protein
MESVTHSDLSVSSEFFSFFVVDYQRYMAVNYYSDHYLFVSELSIVYVFHVILSSIALVLFCRSSSTIRS